MSEKVKTVLNKFFTPRNYIHLWPDLPILSGWLKQTKEAKWHYKKKKKKKSFKRAGTIPRFGNKRLKVIAWPKKKKKVAAAALAAHEEDDMQLTKKQVVDQEDTVKADQEETTMVDE